MGNYVIFGSIYDYDQIIFNDNIKFKNIIYLNGRYRVSNPFLNLLNKIHLSPKINSIIYLPFKSIWNNLYFKNSFDTRPDYFIFFSTRNYLKDLGYFNFLKKKYPYAKFVLYCRDIIETYKNFDIEYYKEYFDMVLTYDQVEAAKYSITFYPQIYTASPPKQHNNGNMSDVFFVGKAKDRLSDLLEIYGVLSDNNQRCDFNIIDVANENQLYSDKILYNHILPYADVLNKIQNSKCILEIIQGNSSGYTLRICEAIFYNKKLITNNKAVLDAPFYNENYIQVIDDMKDIDINFIKNDIKVDYGDEAREYHSLKKFLKFIDDHLN